MEKVELPVTFGDWLKTRRRTLDLTQEELADRAGCSVFALRKIETGERRPSKQLAGLIAAALRLPEVERDAFVRVARGGLSLDHLPAPRSTLQAGHPTAGESWNETGPKTTPRNLPVPMNLLLGRDAELAALERLFTIPQCRLLTLTGVGGIGKTRLAVEFAARWQDIFQGGVFFIPLASINTADLMISAIAEGVDCVFSGPMNPREQLLRSMNRKVDQTALLILDNMEHLVATDSPVIGLVCEMLQRLPQLKILATSRERLNLQGEWIYELFGLPVPPTDRIHSLDEYSSVKLFLQCVQRNHPEITITQPEISACVRICRMMEGVPLAIELAAAWAGILSFEEIAGEIETNMEFLSTSMHDVPERHRSLRASFDYSWGLLTDAERRTLCKMVVFQGGFDRVAAERVAGADLQILASLVSKSFVRREKTGRYDFHEVIRQFVLSHLHADPEAFTRTRDAHSRYYLGFFAERERDLKSANQRQAMRELTDESENLRAGWAWAIEKLDYSAIGAAVRCLGWFFEVSGLIDEGIEQFEPLIQSLRSKPHIEPAQRVLGQAMTQQGLLFFRKGLFDQAVRLMQDSVSLLRHLGDQVILTDPLVYLGIIIHLTGDLVTSRQLIKEGLACAQSSRDDWFVAYAIFNLGYLDSLEGNYLEGYRQMRAGLSIWRQLGDPHSIALGLNFLSPTLIQLRYCQEAEKALRESLDLCRSSANRWGMGTAYRYLGLVKLAHGELDEAQKFLYLSLDTFNDYIVGWDIARSFTYLADTMVKAGDFSEARRTYQEALRLADEVRSIPLMLDALTGLVFIDAWSGDCDKAFRVGAFILKHPASTHEARIRISQIISEMEACIAEQENTLFEGVFPQHSIDTIVGLYQ